MRTIMTIMVVCAVCLSFFCCESAVAARDVNMREYLNEKGEVNMYIAAVKNESGDGKVNTDALQGAIEKALEARRSVDFVFVSSKSSADIVMDVTVVEFLWTEEDPVDVLVTPVTVAVDKAKDENYARMQIDVTVTDAKNGRELWSERVQSTITDDTMSKEASYGMTYERIANNLVKELFRKSGKR